MALTGYLGVAELESYDAPWEVGLLVHVGHHSCNGELVGIGLEHDLEGPQEC